MLREYRFLWRTVPNCVFIKNRVPALSKRHRGVIYTHSSDSENVKLSYRVEMYL